MQLGRRMLVVQGALCRTGQQFQTARHQPLAGSGTEHVPKPLPKLLLLSLNQLVRLPLLLLLACCIVFACPQTSTLALTTLATTGQQVVWLHALTPLGHPTLQLGAAAPARAVTAWTPATATQMILWDAKVSVYCCASCFTPQ